jgi:hypothetical protein
MTQRVKRSRGQGVKRSRGSGAGFPFEERTKTKITADVGDGAEAQKKCHPCAIPNLTFPIPIPLSALRFSL